MNRIVNKRVKITLSQSLSFKRQRTTFYHYTFLTPIKYTNENININVPSYETVFTPYKITNTNIE